MRRTAKFVLTGIAAAGLLLSSCSTTGKKNVSSDKPINTQSQNTSSEWIVWSSASNRPEWTINVPSFEGDKLYFVGLSGKCAVERDAQDDARRNSISQIIQYLGTNVKDKFQQITARYGLSSEISNPTTASRGFVDMVSNGLAKQVKVDKWYIEKWETKLKEIYFLAYGLATVPKNSIDQAYGDAIDKEKENLKEKIAKENNEKAKAQMEDALKAFDQLKESGFTE